MVLAYRDAGAMVDPMSFLWRIEVMPGSREAARPRHRVWFYLCWLAPWLLICLEARTAAALDVPYSVEIAGIEDE
ncbi:hypothetical protein, partial [Salmonella sp. SAL4437]|uniref:hypothetical protein n=1 Tax=Salmonella sp. SAL4437 TaxID=3159892 RepID=UPI00397D0777